MPLARRFGPERPILIAKSGGATPTPSVRSRQIGLAAIRPSYSSSFLRMHRDEGAALALEAARQVLADAADLAVARVHALAGDHLEQVEHEVAVAEAVEEQRDPAEVDGARAEEDQVRVDAVELLEEHADPLGAARHLEVERLLDRHAERRLAAEEREVVHARDVRDGLPVRLLLDVLLDARVHVADHGLEADDELAVEHGHEPQHAVRRRVVGPDVDLEQVRVVRPRA